MTDIVVKQLPGFRRAYKKFSLEDRENINMAIKDIILNPEIGQEKKGDLSGCFVYKFKIYAQEYLLAYSWNANLRILLALGVHENFYRNLKRQS